ncbi:acid phosphatase-domain-containing protein [Coprinopsis sp. MPI-PUGE-AT-0042]|nr:acid phosphatase-domain-containing protein [Coprinopsis sp. MPI-PUGE-AT-0042]
MRDLPKLVAFDLDGTLWRRNSAGDLQLRSDVPRIMKYLYQKNIKMAICSMHDKPKEARDFFNDNNNSISVGNGRSKTLKSLIASGCFVVDPNKSKKKQLHDVKKQTGIDYSDMLFFDDKKSNQVSSVPFAHVGKSGLDWSTFQRGLNDFDANYSSSSDDSSSDDGGPSPPVVRPVVRPVPYQNFTRRLVNIAGGDWNIYPEAIRNTYRGDILWTDGANTAFASAPNISAYNVVRRAGNTPNGAVTAVGLASASPYYFAFQ